MSAERFTYELEREAAATLEDALAQAGTLHEPGQRARYRQTLERAIAQATRAIDELNALDPIGGLTAGDSTDTLDAIEDRSARQDSRSSGRIDAWVSACSTLVTGLAARAEDALHGAGQLSLSAQRAPTPDACNEGWRRVETIVAEAEDFATLALRMAAELKRQFPHARASRTSRHAPERANAAAQRAEKAARAARRIVDERNHAYTFHSDAGFSFGEGWYVAAAAALAGAAIQIEPGTSGTPKAEKFLRDAGLGSCLQTYRSRPRAVKQTTHIVARAFGADAVGAARQLREAFLGEAAIPRAVRDWADRRVTAARCVATGTGQALIWIRNVRHHSHRNTEWNELVELTRRVKEASLVPVWIGDRIGDGEVPDGVVDMTLFSRDATFQGPDMRRAQLQLFEHLKEAHGLTGQVGVTTAGMDGPALLGLPTMYLTEAPNVRMGKWVGVVPGYREVVRANGYLDEVSRGLRDWARRAGG